MVGNIARTLKRFFLAYCVILLSTVALTTLLAVTLWPYLTELLNRWLGYTPTCGCERYAIFPLGTSGTLLFLGLVLIVGLLVVMAFKTGQTLWQTHQFQQRLLAQRLRTTYYHAIPVHLIASDEVLAVCVGYLRPAVYISTALLSTLAGFELLAVIQHEATHAQRLDPAQRLLLMALPSWLPGWRTQLQRYLAGQEIVADNVVSDQPSIQSAFVKLVDQLYPQPNVAVTFFSTSQARINNWLGEHVPLPSLRFGLIAVTIVFLGLLSSYQAFAAEPEAQAFGQCLAVQTMCESVMNYVLQ